MLTILVGIKLLSVGHPASLEIARRITTLKYKAEREDSSLFGETKRRLEMRLKEHWDACERGLMENYAVQEHAWEHHHPIYWEETTVLNHGRGQELLLKEALHIQMTTAEERFNQDGGLEVLGCWTAVMRRQEGAILTDL